MSFASVPYPTRPTTTGGSSSPFIREVQYPVVSYLESVGLTRADLIALIPSDGSTAPGIAAGVDIFGVGGGGAGASFDSTDTDDQFGAPGGLPGLTQVTRIWLDDMSDTDVIYLVVGAGGMGYVGGDGGDGNGSELTFGASSGKTIDNYIFGGSGGYSDPDTYLNAYLTAVSCGAHYSNPRMQVYSNSNPDGPGVGGWGGGNGWYGGNAYNATSLPMLGIGGGGAPQSDAQPLDSTVSLEVAGGGGGGGGNAGAPAFPGGKGLFGGGGGGAASTQPGGDGGDGFFNIRPFAWRTVS